MSYIWVKCPSFLGPVQASSLLSKNTVSIAFSKSFGVNAGTVNLQSATTLWITSGLLGPFQAQIWHSADGPDQARIYLKADCHLVIQVLTLESK